MPLCATLLLDESGAPNHDVLVLSLQVVEEEVGYLLHDE